LKCLNLKVPKVQFSFKVVDARIDACHRSSKGPRLAGIQTRFYSSIQYRASSFDTSFEADKQASTTGQL
jgi:hypothetical protein